MHKIRAKRQKNTVVNIIQPKIREILHKKFKKRDDELVWGGRLETGAIGWYYISITSSTDHMVFVNQLPNQVGNPGMNQGYNSGKNQGYAPGMNQG